MKIHFRYKLLDSREQQVARLLGWQSHPLTMAGLGGPPDLVPKICTYRACFSETDPFYGGYEALLEPCLIDPMNAAAAQTPAIVSQ